jgi:hypothetical protein
MEPINLLVVAASTAIAYFSKSIVKDVLTRRHKSSTLEVVMKDGKKIRIEADQLTSEKAAEITNSQTVVRAF